MDESGQCMGFGTGGMGAYYSDKSPSDFDSEVTVDSENWSTALADGRQVKSISDYEVAIKDSAGVETLYALPCTY
jgi:hypothetical protein